MYEECDDIQKNSVKSTSSATKDVTLNRIKLMIWIYQWSILFIEGYFWMID